MASQGMGTEATRQAHSLPSFNHAPQSCCSCILCRRHGSSSPSCFKTSTSEINGDHPCLHQERCGVMNVHGFIPSFLLAQQSSKPSTPGQHSSPPCLPRSKFGQEKGQEQKSPMMEPPSMKGCGACGAQSNQITLHSWYLVRRIDCSETVKVSVGGFFGTAGNGRFETAAIMQRLDKCRLLAEDGVEVRLAGLIDDHTAISNGFSLNLVQSFLSGFPYTWNHLLDNEFHRSSTNGQDHQILEDGGLGVVAEMSQLSYEGCCSGQARKAPVLSKKELPFNHLQTCNDMALNTKQSMAKEAQAERESKSLSTHTTSQDNEKSETGILNDDQHNSNMTGTVEQDILDASNRSMEGLKTNVLIDQSKCNVENKPAQMPHAHASREPGDTANTQSDAGSTLFARITRSMCKISRHATPKEDSRPRVESSLDSFPSPLIQKNVGEVRQSARKSTKQKDKGEVDGGKVRGHFPKGIETPVETEAQTPERSSNADASLNSREDCVNIQEKILLTETLPENVCAPDAEKEGLHMFTQKSEVMETPVSKIYAKTPKEGKKATEEGSLSTKSSRQCSKRPIILPPLPSPRVPIAKHLISTAFGLKTSRSGRLLVPPLAHWCGQSLLRDKDGGILGISDGAKDMSSNGNGSFKFKPPAEERLQKWQKRLCQAAINPPPKKKKRGRR